MQKNTVIIGAGIAGLAAAARMASKGHAVTVLESNSYYGGKLSSFEQNGFRFDAGPSLFTLPELTDAVFIAAGKDPRDYISYKKMDTICHYFFEDGKRFTAVADREVFCKELGSVFQVEPAVIRKYLRNAEKKYNRVGKIFTEKPIHLVSTWLNPTVFRALLSIPSFGLFTSMDRYHQRKFKHPLLEQYFNRYATYNGSNPYRTPALLTMIPHLEHGHGVYFPMNGMRDVSDSIYKLCIDLGVNFKFNSPVIKLDYSDNKISAVITHEHSFHADYFIANTDIASFYKKLLPQQHASKKISKQERSSSALIFYWGIRKEFKELGLHNIFFSNDYKAEFEKIAGNGVYHDPTVYINITSKENPKDAPTGCENWFVMINVASNRGYFNDQLKAEAKSSILKKLSRLLNCDIAPLIVTEHTLDPVSIEKLTGSVAGSIYGTASNSKMAAFNRHPNFSKEFKNLYFCGGSVHPGGGIPLCLNSAKIVSELIE